SSLSALDRVLAGRVAMGACPLAYAVSTTRAPRNTRELWSLGRAHPWRLEGARASVMDGPRGGRVSHEGGTPQAAPGGPPGVPGVMTYGAPAAGELLVNRYRLEEHIGTDAAGRLIWRGVDTVLGRPVALVI